MNINALNYNLYNSYSSSSSMKKTRYNVSFSSTAVDDNYRKAKLAQQKRREVVKNQRIIAFVSAAGLVVSGAVGALVSNFLPQQNNNGNIIAPPSIEEPFDGTIDFLTEGNLQIDGTLGTENAQVVDEILSSNPKLESAYNKILISLQTFSEHIGEDALSLILSRVDEIGNGKVNPLDVLKILYMESTGRVYSDVESQTILKSSSGACGAFQITKDTQDFINDYYGFSGTEKELNYENPYDNLDLCIYNLRFIADKRAKELAKGENLPTGDNLGAAIMWSYHDGPWAKNITDRGEKYLDKYYNLSILDEFPQVVDYILDGGE